MMNMANTFGVIAVGSIVALLWKYDPKFVFKELIYAALLDIGNNEKENAT